MLLLEVLAQMFLLVLLRWYLCLIRCYRAYLLFAVVAAIGLVGRTIHAHTCARCIHRPTFNILTSPQGWRGMN